MLVQSLQSKGHCSTNQTQGIADEEKRVVAPQPRLPRLKAQSSFLALPLANMLRFGRHSKQKVEEGVEEEEYCKEGQQGISFRLVLARWDLAPTSPHDEPREEDRHPNVPGSLG